jgi:lethal(2) giant larvae protein
MNFLNFKVVQQVPRNPTSTLRSNQSINCVLAKEMRLKHRAPVVHIQVIDQNMQPIPNESGHIVSSSQLASQQAGNSVDTTTTTTTTVGLPNHKVIICSEEQFKVFQLPTLKPVCKFKLTAVEGARVRRIGYASYISKSDSKYSEYCLSCLTNLGDISVYNLPQLKRQALIQCMKQQDINAITSFVFSKLGQAFYLQSPSEFVHISMSARDNPQQLMKDTGKESNAKSVQQVASKTPGSAASKPPPSSSSSGTPGSASGSKKQQQTAKPTENGHSSSSSSSQQGTSNTSNAVESPVATNTAAQAAPPVPAPRSLAQTNADSQR